MPHQAFVGQTPDEVHFNQADHVHDLAMRILTVVLKYVQLINKLEQTITEEDEATQHEYEFHERFVAAFFPNQLKTYQRLSEDRGEFSQEARDLRNEGSATLDELVAKLFKEIAGQALFGTTVELPWTRAQKLRHFFETGEYTAE